MNKIPESDDPTGDGKFRYRHRSVVRVGMATAGLLVAFFGAWTFYKGTGMTEAIASTEAPLAKVTVSHPLQYDLDTRVGFLGQFSAVDKVELRAQVGGTLTGIYFKDGDVVHKGALLFTIDPVPYEIRLAQAQAQLESSQAKWALAKQELSRANELQKNDAGTIQDVQQRTADLQSTRAAIDNAQAQIRDARFDLDHCRVSAPFSGRIGTHLVSVGNLVAGSRAATSPTTLLATLVSLNPIYLDFDMGESDYQSFSRYRRARQGTTPEPVELGLGNESGFPIKGALDFVNNVMDRSSGTIHTRATVQNPDLSLTPGEFARVRVIVASVAPTLLVPDASVLPDQSQHAVLVVTAGGVVMAKPVVIGDLRGGLRVIRSGISKDDQVIIAGLPFAAPGTKVSLQAGTIQYLANQD